MKRMTTILAMAMLVTVAMAAAEEKADSKPAENPKAIKASELQIRYSAMNHLHTFLSDAQKKSQSRIENVMAFLKSIDQLKGYENSSIKGKTEKAKWPFEKVVASAVQYQKDHPSSFSPQGAGEDDQIMQKKVDFMTTQCKKTYDGLVTLKQTEADLSAYLTKIEKLGDYKKWAQVQNEKKAEAFAAEQKKIAADLKAKHEKDVADRKAEHAAKAARKRAHREELLRMRFQYDMQRSRDNAMVDIARHGGFSRDPWWNDRYNDVYNNTTYQSTPRRGTTPKP